MTGLDIRYIPINTFQEYFVGKDDGFPLAGGKVYFYRDIARSVEKEVFQLTGSPPNYSYASLPNPLTLSSVGTFQDELTGDDIVVYLLPEDDDHQTDLYFAEVYDSSDVFQFSRSAFPNSAESSSEQNDLINYVPNGQFLIHNYISSDGTVPDEAGTGQQNVILSPSGWFFIRSQGSSSVDKITYDFFDAPITTPTSDPKYAIRLECVTPDPGDSIKALEIRFNNVNKFSSDTQEYTFAFEGKSNASSQLPITLNLYKYYGDGGSTPETSQLTLFILDTSYDYYKYPFAFGSNEGKTLGPNDYVSIQIAYPKDVAHNGSFANFVLTLDNVDVNFFPATTDNKFIYQTISGSPPVPAYDGSDFGLPLVLYKEGLVYDGTRHVGMLYFEATEFSVIPRASLFCDGSTLDAEEYSDEKIPYSRLRDKLTYSSDPWGISLYGTGHDSCTATGDVVDDSLVYITVNNKNVDGIVGKGSGKQGDRRIDTFTSLLSVLSVDDIIQIVGKYSTEIRRITSINSYGIFFNSNLANKYADADIIKLVGIVTGTSGTQTLTTGNDYTSELSSGDHILVMEKDEYTIDTINATTITTDELLVDNYSANYLRKLLTYTHANDGATPTGFTFDYFDTYRSPGWTTTKITVLGGAFISAGSFFEFYNKDDDKHIAWYEVDGSGSEPTITAERKYKISIDSTDTVAQVSDKTYTELNYRFYGIPDFRGKFIRTKDATSGKDPDASIRSSGSDWDPDNTTRDNNVFGATGDINGTNQIEEVGPHVHNYLSNLISDTGVYPWLAANHGSLSDLYTYNFVLVSAGVETRPINQYVDVYIGY